MELRDVIVVGAGPGGATAATQLAQQGHDVLLLDRTPFPRDKTCGDAFPASAARVLADLGMGPAIEAAVAREEFYPVERVRILSPRGIEVKAEFSYADPAHKTYVAPRLNLDVLIQAHAVKSGAEFRVAQVQAPIIEEGQVVGVRARVNGATAEWRSRLVIGADGVTSAIARALRPKEHPPQHRAVALRAYIEDMAEIDRTVEFFLYREILPGYAWIFPLGGGRANIGLGMRLDIFKHRQADLRQMLDAFLALPDIHPRLQRGGVLSGVKTWQLNFGSIRDVQRAFAGALLVGDAGGLIDPLTGGGIDNAIISATLAADVAAAALRVGDFSLAQLERYETECEAALWPGFRRSYNLQRGLLRFPLLIDLLARTMRANSSFAQTFLAKL